eukprot:CAMPEP_0197036564 /NCGR_PEP_ID=MMETSP1384-20130603/14037_1 /TAXON_ID=29189 /ORGANISM="Ammonia sp." /LENGTH=315 /DNA_ID=CAMNT_0042466757 /DNA_START=1 /DNA_END=948 /DNA_ORIENTATION=-
MITGLQFDPDNHFQVTRQFTQDALGNECCFLSSDWGHNLLYVANYGADARPSAGVFKIDPISHYLEPFAQHNVTEPGSNGVPDRQKSPHVHCVMPCKHSADALEFYATDLGRDCLVHYKIDEQSGALSVISSLRFEAGAGPRHIAYNPARHDVLYVSLEMGSAIAVVQYDYKTNRLVKIAQIVSTLPSDVTNDAGSVLTTSHIECDQTGKYVYCANRGHDSIVRFVVHEKTGLLDEEIGGEWIGSGGKVPRHFGIDPTNQYLVVANQEGAPFDNVAVFRIDHGQNGALRFVHCVQTGCPTYIQFFEKPNRLRAKL